VLPDTKTSPHRPLIVMGVTIRFLCRGVLGLAAEESGLSFELPDNRQRLRTIKGLWGRKKRNGINSHLGLVSRFLRRDFS
jgi:hypothetical protein